MKLVSSFLWGFSAFISIIGVGLAGFFAKAIQKKRDEKKVDKVLNTYEKIDSAVDNRSDVDVLRKL